MSAPGRPEVFFLMFEHPERGPLMAWLIVSPTGGGAWQTKWDIGTVDTDPKLSDTWFCREQYEQRFTRIMQDAAEQAGDRFELEGVTSRWGRAGGMRRQIAVGLASRVFALWEEILVEWETVGPE
jgi:hypothetical protein